jgi:hypothetical protein
MGRRRSSKRFIGPSQTQYPHTIAEAYRAEAFGYNTFAAELSGVGKDDGAATSKYRLKAMPGCDLRCSFFRARHPGGTRSGGRVTVEAVWICVVDDAFAGATPEASGPDRYRTTTL